MKRYVLFLMCAIVGVQVLHAQAMFTCDFEDSLQNKQWVLVSGDMADEIPNKWVIGEAVNNGGKQSLYISADGGKTATYAQHNSYAICHMDVTLNAGTYDLSFDWQGMGYTDGGMDGLYVCWVPDRDPLSVNPETNPRGDSIMLNYNKSNTLTSILNQYAVDFSGNGNKRLYGGAAWKNCRGKIKADGKHRRLAFIWLTSANSKVINPGGCIDNINIIDSRRCPAPVALTTTKLGNQQVRLQWIGDAEQYEVRCYSYIDKTWRNIVVQDTTVVFSGLPEGVTDYYVNALCEDSLRSAIATCSEFLYYPENHCIDYLTLDSTNCYVSEQLVSTTPVSSLTWINKKVDFTYTSGGSRHTVHYRQDETDPRTCGGLKTVPEGEVASVRLGNWNVGAEAERIEYKLHVNARVNPVLLLKYAVVLQKPGSGCDPNPGFLLRVLDKTGQLVSKCASADFDFKKAADAEWEACMSSGEVRWKDWTTVGVNLADYDGETLTIQLTTYDCGGTGHYGYAYFTLGCSDGQLSGMSCATENLRFTAPDGFNYRWYKVTEPTKILGRQQTFEVTPNDTCHYKVDLMFAQDSTCYFSLTASAQPYQPVAKANYHWHPQECQNEVYFTNISTIKETNQITGEITETGKPVNWVLWDFGDGTISYEPTPVHVFPDEGGPMNVKLIAHLSDCVDTLFINDVLPAIGTRFDTIPVQQCFGTEYTYSYTDYTTGDTRTKHLTESGLYTYTLRAFTGCDSLVTINLQMTDTVYQTIDTLIMRGETYTAGGKTFSETGNYRLYLTSEAGCDSVLMLNLRVYDKLVVAMDSLTFACHGDPDFALNYQFLQGWTDTYSVDFTNTLFTPVSRTRLTSPATVDIPIPDNAAVRPNIYRGNVTFYDSISGNVTLPFALELRYNSEVLTQRWNDVLAVRNETYNGGYHFSDFQWFVNGLPVEGATQPYFYDEKGLDMNAEYSARVTRTDDGVSLLICGIHPTFISAESKPDIPTLVGPQQPMSLMGRKAGTNGIARWFTPFGLNIATQQVVEGSGIVSPAQSGMYLLTLEDEQTGRTTYSVIVR